MSERRDIRQEIRVPIWWKRMTRREREVMQRVLERHARELAATWDAEDALSHAVPLVGVERRSTR